MRALRKGLLALSLISLCVLLVACPATQATSPAATLPATSQTTTTPPATTTEPPSTTPPQTSTPPPATQTTSSPTATQTETQTTTPTPQTVIPEEFWQTFKNHFGFMPALWDYENAPAAGGAYDRPFFEKFQWGMIEKEPGYFDFYETDETVREAQAVGLHVLANIQPFAPWDQEVCHGPQNFNSGLPGVQSTRYKPCDMEAYANFLTRLVERYDGDSIDDMPGLTVPIKHWELMNEPEFQTEPIIYFQGTPAEYVDTLKVTYETIKQADPEAYIVQGGMASMYDVSIDFWEGVFDEGGGQYMDILNMHSIGHGEHLNIPAFKELLEPYGLQDKTIWVTEVQFQQSHQTEGYTNEDYAKILARSYIFALANGVDKLFYVNLRMPPGDQSGTPFDESSALITDDGEKSALFYSHLTVADMLGDLDMDAGDTVAIISERVNGWFVEEGEYKFTIQGRTIYALWGSGSLPAEITGQVHVIDITGAETVSEASSVQLSDSPIFVLLD